LQYERDKLEKAGDKSISVGLYAAESMARELLPLEKQHIIDSVDSVQLVNRYYYKDGKIGEDLLGQEIPTGEERTYIGLSTIGIKYYNQTYEVK
jgi:hypothetical protein